MQDQRKDDMLSPLMYLDDSNKLKHVAVGPYSFGLKYIADIKQYTLKNFFVRMFFSVKKYSQAFLLMASAEPVPECTKWMRMGKTFKFDPAVPIDIHSIYILDGGLYQLMFEHAGSMLLPNLARW
jgi:hypothetical protein